MSLLLRVTSAQARLLGDGFTHVFGARGGSIGRGAQNDWILPDAECFVSVHHASVIERGGRWFLTDHSTNGTFVNGSVEPLGRGNQYALSDLDRLRIGSYEILVKIMAPLTFA